MAAASLAGRLDPRVLSVFEVVSAYFTDIFFNHVYASARAAAGAGAAGLPDEYVRQLRAIVIGMKTDATHYARVAQDVHRHFAASTRYGSLSYADFVDRVVRACTPEAYHARFTPADKDELLASALCDLAAGLAAAAAEPDMLRRVAVEHERAPQATIRALQDAAVDLLAAKRAALHSRFLSRAGEAPAGHVERDVAEDLKRALRRAVAERAEALAAAAAAEARAAEAEAGAERLAAMVREARAREAKYRQAIELLRAGRDAGAAEAGAGLRVPRAERIAEVRPRVPLAPPPREAIAERDSSGSDDASSGSDDASSTSSDGKRRRRAPPAKAAKPGGFFRPATAMTKPPPAAKPQAFTPRPQAAAAPSAFAAALAPATPDEPAEPAEPAAPAAPAAPAKPTNLMELYGDFFD